MYGAGYRVGVPCWCIVLVYRVGVSCWCMVVLSVGVQLVHTPGRLDARLMILDRSGNAYPWAMRIGIVSSMLLGASNVYLDHVGGWDLQDIVRIPWRDYGRLHAVHNISQRQK